MNKLNYNKLSNEITERLETIEAITLATCDGDKVTARTMCPVNDGLAILFGTSRKSEKAEQIRQNAKVAFAIDNIQIEAIAEIAGHPDDNPNFTEKYTKKYPHFGSLYPSTPDSIVVIAWPKKITLFKYLGKSYVDVLDIENNNAFRQELE
jgi:general stress protein 26